MPVTQSFLPIIERRTKIIHGMVAIDSTEFEGDEEEFEIGSEDYPIVKYEPTVSQTTSFPWYMAIDLSYLQVRSEFFKTIPGFIPLNDVLPGQWWTSSAIGGQKRDELGALLNGLIYGFGSNFDVVVTPEPEVDSDEAEYVWVASVPFANQPQCSFFDFNWVEAVQLSNDEGSPARLVITSVVQVTLDEEDEVESPQSKIRAVMVITGQPSLNRATYNTVRLVKMPTATLVAGEEYRVKGTIYGQDGFEENIHIDITIS